MTISQSSFTFVSDLVRRETAMLYDPGKEYLVEARLLPLAREAGCSDVDSYVIRLGTDLAERRKALDALTINETSWFRDNAPYQAFTDTLLPSVIANRGHVKHISIWSAACSSGQEAYSLTMLLDQHLPPGWTAQILATDVSTAMLERVKAGRYSQVEMNRGMPAPMLVKHFTRAGSEWEVADNLKRMVRTQHLNLATAFPLLPTFDIVFLRNVLIYFDMDTKRDILRRVHQVVAPDGFLLLGSSETTLDMEDHWGRESVGRVQVHRPAGTTSIPHATSAPAAWHPTAMTGA
ncbi:CheR family methyltransferase [Marmoricola sp. RAF53]|uniref:CheR family methyltransferase n=1 Tax=Marmoricola sp. RAF53 TaxID=3233059 RepID=UPI003F9502F3